MKFCLAGSGHIAGVINPPADKPKYGYWTKTGKAPKSPDAWLAGATEHAGSWWPEWLKWVSRHSGGEAPARMPGDGGLPALEGPWQLCQKPPEIAPMSDTEPFIRHVEASGQPFEVMARDPALADTADFCAHYGVAPDHSANAILVKSKTGPKKFACCVVLATCRLTSTRCAAPWRARALPARGDARHHRYGNRRRDADWPAFGPAGVGRRAIADLEYIILGGGNRASKLKVPPALLLALPGVELVDDLAQPVPVAAD